MMDKKYLKTFYNAIQKRYLKDNYCIKNFTSFLRFTDYIGIERTFIKAQAAIVVFLFKDMGIYDDIRIKMIPYFIKYEVKNIFDYIVTIENRDIFRAVNIILGKAKYNTKERNDVIKRLKEQIDKLNNLRYLDDIIK